MHTLVPFRSRLFLTEFIPTAPEVSSNAGNLLPAFRPNSKGEAIGSAIHWVTFHGTSNDVQSILKKLHMLDIVSYGDGEIVRP